jgi:hypothetical protein
MFPNFLGAAASSIVEDKEATVTQNPTIISQNSPQTTDASDADDQDDEEGEEKWDLKHIFTIEEISSEKQHCMTKKCPLIACSTYVSSLGDTWHSCLDCQENDYGGWPEKTSEFPIKLMTEEHRRTIAEKCTGSYTPTMPNLPMEENSSGEDPSATMTSAVNAATVTPPPSGTKKKTFEGAKLPSKKSTVAPHPISSKPSKQALAIHQKWQADAKKLGGDRIIVSKPEAKKKIFALLKDSFRPMNITEIYQVSTIPHIRNSCYDKHSFDTLFFLSLEIERYRTIPSSQIVT